MIENVRRLPVGTVIESDICIVGGGAAGITIAREARAERPAHRAAGGRGTPRTGPGPRSPSGRGRSGNVPRTARDVEAPRLGRGHDGMGRPVRSLRCDRPRTSGVGPHSGWPITYEELVPYLVRANEVCEAGPFDYTTREALPGAQPEMIAGFDGPDIVTSRLERWSPPTNFARRYGRASEKETNVRILLGAHALALDLTDNRARVAGVRAASSDGNRFSVTADTYVVACGGLENARLLLASNHQAAAGIGNHHDNVGRYYMSHLIGVLGWVTLRSPDAGFVYDFERTARGRVLPPPILDDVDGAVRAQGRERHRPALPARRRRSEPRKPDALGDLPGQAVSRGPSRDSLPRRPSALAGRTTGAAGPLEDPGARRACRCSRLRRRRFENAMSHGAGSRPSWGRVRATASTSSTRPSTSPTAGAGSSSPTTATPSVSHDSKPRSHSATTTSVPSRPSTACLPPALGDRNRLVPRVRRRPRRPGPRSTRGFQFVGASPRHDADVGVAGGRRRRPGLPRPRSRQPLCRRRLGVSHRRPRESDAYPGGARPSPRGPSATGTDPSIARRPVSTLFIARATLGACPASPTSPKPRRPLRSSSTATVGLTITWPDGTDRHVRDRGAPLQLPVRRMPRPARARPRRLAHPRRAPAAARRVAPSSSARGASRSTGTTATRPASTPGACSGPGAPPTTTEPNVRRRRRRRAGASGSGGARAPARSRRAGGARSRSPGRGRSRAPAARESWLGGLDALGGHRQAERVPELHDRGDDRAAFGVVAERLDERLVDLQRVHRQRPEVRERRLPGAEVVDADPHADRRELAAARRPTWSRSAMSVDSVISSSEQRRIEAGARERALHGRDQVVVGELARREVHRHRRAARARSTRRPTSRPARTPRAAPTRRSARSGRSPRRRRGTRRAASEPALGVLPPQQAPRSRSPRTTRTARAAGSARGTRCARARAAAPTPISSRATARSRIGSANTSMRPRPGFLAANIATLASRSRRSGVSSSPSESATPMLAVRNTSPVAEHERLGEHGSHALGDGDDVAPRPARRCTRRRARRRRGARPCRPHAGRARRAARPRRTARRRPRGRGCR